MIRAELKISCIPRHALTHSAGTRPDTVSHTHAPRPICRSIAHRPQGRSHSHLTLSRFHTGSDCIDSRATRTQGLSQHSTFRSFASTTVGELSHWRQRSFITMEWTLCHQLISKKHVWQAYTGGGNIFQCCFKGTLHQFYMWHLPVIIWAAQTVKISAMSTVALGMQHKHLGVKSNGCPHEKCREGITALFTCSLFNNQTSCFSASCSLFWSLFMSVSPYITSISINGC